MGKNQISPLLAPLEKFLGKSHTAPPLEKILSTPMVLLPSFNALPDIFAATL